MKRILRALALIAVFAVPAAAFAGEIRVPGDTDSLRDALAAAQPGDTVVVEGGVHEGPFKLDTSDVVLEGRGAKILDPFGRYGMTTQGSTLSIRGQRVTVRGFEFLFGSVSVGGDDAVVEGCRFRRSPVLPISISGHRAAVRGNRLDGDRKAERAVAGIAVTGRTATVEGNRIDGRLSGYGIWVDGHDARVAGNTFPRLLRVSGIEVRGSRTVVADNTMRAEDGRQSWPLSGILVQGDDSTVTGNDVDWTEGSESAVILDGDRGLVEGNDVEMSSSTGIRIRGEGNVLRRNTATGPRRLGNRFFVGHGIAVRGSRNRLDRNSVTTPCGDGIRVAGETGNEVLGCTALGARGCGIGNWAGETAVTGSTFLENGIDVLNAGSLGSFDDNTFVSGGPADRTLAFSDRFDLDDRSINPEFRRPREQGGGRAGGGGE